MFYKIRKIRKIREIFPKNLSDGISGNFGKFFPGIPGNSGNPGELFRKFGGFSQNARCGAVYTVVKRGENWGKSGFFSKKVPGKSPENPPGNLREILGKNGRFFPVFFGGTQRYSLFLENPRGKFRRKIPRFPGNFSPGNPPNPRKSRKFPEKKGQKWPFLEKLTHFCTRGFKTHIFKERESSKKKCKIYTRFYTGFSEIPEISPEKNRKKWHF